MTRLQMWIQVQILSTAVTRPAGGIGFPLAFFLEAQTHPPTPTHTHTPVPTHLPTHPRHHQHPPPTPPQPTPSPPPLPPRLMRRLSMCNFLGTFCLKPPTGAAPCRCMLAMVLDAAFLHHHPVRVCLVGPALPALLQLLMYPECCTSARGGRGRKEEEEEGCTGGLRRFWAGFSETVCTLLSVPSCHAVRSAGASPVV